jgi:hypothetical protein
MDGERLQHCVLKACLTCVGAGVLRGAAPPLLQVGEEVHVLVAEGLRPADLVQELLLLR